MTEKPKRMLMLTLGHIDHSSSRIRALSFIPFLEKLNYQITWVPRVPKMEKGLVNRLLFALFKRYYYVKTRLLLNLSDWDLVFVQRQFIEAFFLKQLSKRGIPLIYDFDDAIFLNDEVKTGLMVSFAQTTIISTPFLESFCQKHSKSPIVIPTSVDGELIKYQVAEIHSPPMVIGWIGSKWTTPYLKEAEDGIRNLSQKMNIKLLLIGAETSYRPDGILTEHIEWKLEDEPEYFKQMDIGIMPLPKDDFTMGKGGYKLYLYMAAGLPIVASPVGVNREIVEIGENGYHAINAQEWENSLQLLLEDFELRKKVGLKGRQIFEQKYSLDGAFQLLKKVLH